MEPADKKMTENGLSWFGITQTQMRKEG